jgi:LacI family transcriptional regulator
MSGATVSRVLSGRTDYPISPETRLKVLEAAEKLGYRPNVTARALSTGRTGLVGFWMSLQYSRYRGQVLDRMRALLADTDLTMAVTDVDEAYAARHSFDRALRVPVDGIIAFDTSATIEAFGNESETPFVSLGAYWSQAGSFVGVDLQAGAEAAMDHLLSLGRKDIVYIAPRTSGLTHFGTRFDVYRRRMEAAGLTVRVLAPEAVSVESVGECLAWHLRTSPLDGLLCMNDDLAIIAVHALPGVGLAPGKDVSVVGFDGIEETSYGQCPITTVRQPIEEMCALTLTFLQAQIEDPKAPLQRRVLQPELVIRASSTG